MLTEAQVHEFNRNGCLIGGKVLDDEQVEQLRRELDRVIDKGKTGFTDTEPHPVLIQNLGRHQEKPVWQIVNIWEASPPFQQLLFHPHIVRAISQLTGQTHLMVWHDQIQYKPAHHGGINMWHQDAPLWPILRPHTPVVDRPRRCR
jgi:phytanoyl-CoA hydroxylase